MLRFARNDIETHFLSLRGAQRRSNLDFFNSPSGTYDVVTCIETLEHIPEDELEGFIASLHAKVSEKGMLIICVPTVNRPLNTKHYRHYMQELLQQQLRPYFQIRQTTWLFSIGLWTNILNRLLTNKIFILQHTPTLRLISKIHKKLGFFATPSNGAHLVAVASACNRNKT